MNGSWIKVSDFRSSSMPAFAIVGKKSKSLKKLTDEKAFRILEGKASFFTRI